MNDELNGDEIETEGINEAEYSTGFNWGYIIAEQNEELAKELLEGMERISDREQGMYFGFNEFFAEKQQERETDLKRLRQDKSEKGRDLDR